MMKTLTQLALINHEENLSHIQRKLFYLTKTLKLFLIVLYSLSNNKFSTLQIIPPLKLNTMELCVLYLKVLK